MTIQDVVILTDEYKDIVFYLKVLVRCRQFEEAIRLVNSQINKEYRDKEQKAKMIELKEQIQLIEKKHIAMGVLNRGEGIKKAVEYSGLLEVDVLRLKRKLLEKEQENKRKKEENDEGEEPKYIR